MYGSEETNGEQAQQSQASLPEQINEQDQHNGARSSKKMVSLGKTGI